MCCHRCLCTALHIYKMGGLGIIHHFFLALCNTPCSTLISLHELPNLLPDNSADFLANMSTNGGQNNANANANSNAGPPAAAPHASAPQAPALRTVADILHAKGMTSLEGFTPDRNHNFTFPAPICRPQGAGPPLAAFPPHNPTPQRSNIGGRRCAYPNDRGIPLAGVDEVYWAMAYNRADSWISTAARKVRFNPAEQTELRQRARAEGRTRDLTIETLYLDSPQNDAQGNRVWNNPVNYNDNNI